MKYNIGDILELEYMGEKVLVSVVPIPEERKKAMENYQNILSQIVWVNDGSTSWGIVDNKHSPIRSRMFNASGQ